MYTDTVDKKVTSGKPVKFQQKKAVIFLGICIIKEIVHTIYWKYNIYPQYNGVWQYF